MWGSVIRVGARYAFSRRWRNTIAWVGAILLGGIGVLLIDAKMYLSAGFVGCITAAALLSLVLRYLRTHRENCEIEHRRQGAAAKRAAAIEARNEKIDNVRASTLEMAKGVGRSAAGLVNVTRNGLSVFARG